MGTSIGVAGESLAERRVSYQRGIQSPFSDNERAWSLSGALGRYQSQFPEPVIFQGVCAESLYLSSSLILALA
jgi:hypothetical protein